MAGGAGSSSNGIRAIYRFADRVDVQLMGVGLLLALIQAALPAFVWVEMGKFINIALERERNKTIALQLQSIPLEVDDKTNSTSQEFHFHPTTSAFDDQAMRVFVHMMALSGGTFVAAFLQRLAWEMSSIRQVFRVKRAYISKLLHMDVAWLESRHSGQVAGMLHDHADSIYQGIADHVPMIIFISAYLLVTLGVCFSLQWDVTLVMCSALPILIAVRLIFSKWFCKTVEAEQKLQGKMNNLVQETFNCIRTVIAFSGQKQTLCKYEKLVAETAIITDQRLTASSVYDSLAQVLFTEVIFTVALFYGIWRVGVQQTGHLSALAINMLYMCVTSISIGFHLNGVSSAIQNAEELNGILNEAPTIESDLNRHRESIRKPKGRGDIRFNDVYFAYPSRPDIEVLKGITLNVRSGEHLAIVGASGSGKSTLTALLLRFYDPQKGTITLDNVNIQKMDPDDLRAHMGLVSQEPVLFDGTISDNIRYGRLDATQAEINEAARKAEAWQFICTLPDGMRTRVGDRGMQLSGGQKQRVAIARAVIRYPSVVIFDEATSALDTKHEVEVQKAIDAASHGLTTITIAHRLTTVRNADRIIVLECGEIVEEGSPEQLLANADGRFHRMYMEQRLMLDSIEFEPAIIAATSVSAVVADASKSSLAVALSFGIGASDIPNLDDEAKRRAWARSSLGAHRKLGKSYSVQSMDSERLAMPVMSKKRRRLDDAFKTTNIMEVSVGDTCDEEFSSLPGKKTNFEAVWNLIKAYKKGYMRLAVSIPVTVLRGLFFLLVCFEFGAVLSLAEVDEEDINERLFITTAIFLALIIIKTILEIIGRLYISVYGHGFCDYMRGEMFRKILRHGAAYFDEERNTAGRLTHRVIADTASLNRIVGDKLDLLLPAIVCSFVSVTLAIILQWKLALLCGFQFPAFFLFRLVELRETTKRQRQMVDEEKKAANLATVVLSNMSTIKAYTLQEHFESVFCDTLRPLRNAMIRQSYISSFVYACQFSFTYILIGFTSLFGKDMMQNDELDPMTYILVVLLTQFGANFFSQLIASVTDFTKARVAAENILKVINEKAVDMDNLSDEGLQPIIKGNLSMNNVDFRYPSRPIAPVLRRLNLSVKAGQSIALVGPSGSGKSSIVQLFQRLYNPTSGSVMIDKHDLRTLNPAYLRRLVVSVNQEPSLFSFTLRENIAYGLPDDEATLGKIEQAAKMANIHDFILSLPQGYDTEVGEFGAQLSGGQKQRIAIARALIRNPVVLLLDEATAALDSTSEKAVQAALESASKNCTCIQVAHRLSSIRNVDVIIVLVDGEILERGSHHELMERRGIYYEMNHFQEECFNKANFEL